MGKCTEAKCDKDEIGTSGRCHKHGGKVAVKATRNAIFSLENADATKTYATAQSADQAKTWLQGKCDNAQFANAPGLIAAMQDGEHSGRTKKSSGTSIGVVFHASQGAPGKAGSLSVFWTEETPGSVTIVAVGNHTGSSTYDISWKGKTWKWGNSTAASQIK